jgi:Type II CAAX prenyl endopeptidase Rce1-like
MRAQRLCLLLCCSLLVSLFCPPRAEAEPNYHLVGWVNTFVPGGGQFLLGNYEKGVFEASLELSTLYIGYKNSARVPFTLDGVPEDLPPVGTTFVTRKSSMRRVCSYDSVLKRNVCRMVPVTSLVSTSSSEVDVSNSLYADWLQEFGLKFHMVNAYDAFRKAAGPNVSTGSQRIDYTSTRDLFFAPFQWENLKSAWVFPALLISGAALIYNYQTMIKSGQMGSTAPLNKSSDRLYSLTYLGVFPTGSAVPEEMFYRGFLQYEAYGILQSPFFSIPVSTALYAFSHSAADRSSAALTGAYVGMITHFNEGQLAKGIAYHFWADVMAGIYQITMVRNQSRKVQLLNFDFKF